MPMADQGKGNTGHIEQDQVRMLTNINFQSHLDPASWI
jgi:hypothetical protein